MCYENKICTKSSLSRKDVCFHFLGQGKSKVNTTTIGNESEKCEHLLQKYKDRSDTAVTI